MKIFLLVLSFSFLFLKTSFAKWTPIIEGSGDVNRGDIFYVDFETLRKVDGFIYIWSLSDYLKPTDQGYFSTKTYKELDCKLFRLRSLSYSFHLESMGKGTGKVLNNSSAEWIYPPPNTVNNLILRNVCNY